MTPAGTGVYDVTSYLKDSSVFDVAEGFVKCPTGVGIGIEIDEEMVRKVSKECATPWRCLEFFGPDGAVREW